MGSLESSQTCTVVHGLERHSYRTSQDSDYICQFQPLQHLQMSNLLQEFKEGKPAALRPPTLHHCQCPQKPRKYHKSKPLEVALLEGLLSVVQMPSDLSLFCHFRLSLKTLAKGSRVGRHSLAILFRDLARRTCRKCLGCLPCFVAPTHLSKFSPLLPLLCRILRLMLYEE